MQLEIIRVRHAGDLKSERLVLKVLQATDVGGFLVCDSTYADDTSVSNKLRHVFWFPDKRVNVNDFVVLYSGKGADGEIQNNAGTVTHRFYWGLRETVWNKDGDAAVLLKIEDWVSKRIVSSKTTS